MEITTYNLTPHLPINGKTDGLTTEFFREIVNKWVRACWDKFIQKRADPSLFFNHDMETGKTRVGYPLVIYHFVDGSFYITGINEGVLAVDILAKQYKNPFREAGILFPGFKKTESAEFEIATLPDKQYNYRLVKWIPFHHKNFKDYTDLPFTEKVKALNQRLQKHLEADLSKYLELNFENLTVEVTGLVSTYPEPILYEGHKYYAYDIEFMANVNFPDFLTLGNNKSLGFGRIVLR